MSVLYYNACMMNALLRQENEIQHKIIKRLKCQQTSKSETSKIYHETQINKLTEQLDDVYTMMVSKNNSE